MNTYAIRSARESDLIAIQSIERAAGLPFTEIGMAFVAGDEPPSIEALREFVVSDKAWVSTDLDDKPVAYLLVEIVDGNAHLDQVSVHSDYAHRKIGLALLNHMVEWAREHDLPAVTLTTYTEVPWNGPYYERFGFRYLAETEETPGLKKIRAAELAHGLDQWPRACMFRAL
ncbi:GNAT family N-acetyltransferase [Rhodococcus sp. ARC_M6]|uniref:GNAT family N-acetyltransferase n=1 Tax=Rhodococcus sp. ARC_M6 TaxID=2928852 RepID=UPI001FB3D83A|nr:GNAT family N-acetyltransferase [Rhodococcus sp. ARC_M6]MCJ0906306.1 GNAT family N-acetyltransferase [Rhodococcus sp. ARC_M6]